VTTAALESRYPWITVGKRQQHGLAALERFVYVRVDGVHVNIRLEEDKLCLLVVVGGRADGSKDLVALAPHLVALVRLLTAIYRMTYHSADGSRASRRDQRADGMSKVEVKRELILQAAGKVFAERGYHATGIADIAKELGAGHGTFYRYFKNKEDIARSLIAEALRRIMDALTDEDPGLATSLPLYRAQVRRIGHKLFDLVLAEPHLCRILCYDAIAVSRADAGFVHQSMEASGAYTALFIRNGQSRGFLRQDVDAHVVGLAINGMILAVASRMLHIPDPEAMREPWLKVVESLMFEGLGR